MDKRSQDKNDRAKRRYARVPQHLPIVMRVVLPVAGGISTSVIYGVATDLGPIGLHVLVGSPYNVGTRFRIELEIEGQPLTFVAEVRHSRWVSATAGMVYGHGMQIVSIDKATVRVIATYLVHLIPSRRAAAPALPQMAA